MHEDQVLQLMWKENTACIEYFYPEVLFIYFLRLQEALSHSWKSPFCEKMK